MSNRVLKGTFLTFLDGYLIFLPSHEAGWEEIRGKEEITRALILPLQINTEKEVTY